MQMKLLLLIKERSLKKVGASEVYYLNDLLIGKNDGLEQTMES